MRWMALLAFLAGCPPEVSNEPRNKIVLAPEPEATEQAVELPAVKAVPTGQATIRWGATTAIVPIESGAVRFANGVDLDYATGWVSFDLSGVEEPALKAFIESTLSSDGYPAQVVYDIETLMSLSHDLSQPGPASTRAFGQLQIATWREPLEVPLTVKAEGEAFHFKTEPVAIAPKPYQLSGTAWTKLQRVWRASGAPTVSVEFTLNPAEGELPVMNRTPITINRPDIRRVERQNLEIRHEQMQSYLENQGVPAEFREAVDMEVLRKEVRSR